MGPRLDDVGPSANVISIAADDPSHVALALNELILVQDELARSAGLKWRDATAVQSDNGWIGTGFSGLVSNSVFVSEQDPALMVLSAFDAGNLLVSTDTGSTWSALLRGVQTYGGGQGVVERDDGRLVSLLGQGGSFAGVAVSQDVGRTWVHRVGAETGLPGDGSTQRLGGAAVVEGEFVISVGQELFRSSDGFDWVSSPTPVPFTSIATGGDGRLYGGGDSGLYVSSDGGDSFEPVDGGPEAVSRVRADPFDEDAVYLTSWRSRDADRGLWRYDGTNWDRLDDDYYVYDVAIDPTTPGRIALSTDDPPFHDATQSSGVKCSLDGGETWYLIDEGLALRRVRGSSSIEMSRVSMPVRTAPVSPSPNWVQDDRDREPGGAGRGP